MAWIQVSGFRFQVFQSRDRTPLKRLDKLGDGLTEVKAIVVESCCGIVVDKANIRGSDDLTTDFTT